MNAVNQTTRRADAAGEARVLVVDAERTLFELIEEWLAPLGCRVLRHAAHADAPPARCDLVVVDLPFPRGGGSNCLNRIARDHPATPVLALSSSFLPGVECGRWVASTLGVARVLAMPVARETLVAAVGELLRDDR